MKKFSLTLLAIAALSRFSSAQNTFPPSGNVGIGIASGVPNVLTIKATNDWVLLDRPATGNYIGTSYSTAGSLKWFAGLRELGTDRFSFFNFTNVIEAVSLLENGNLGIGEESPLSMFQVDGGCTKANIGDASGIGLNYGTSYLGFNAARSSGNWTMHTDGMHNGGGLTYASIEGDLYFAPIASTGTADQVLSDATVKSRIALRVQHDGTTYAKKVIVELTGWPDYVFRPTYNLKPLSEVKSYIDLNHHLPELPSEKEVAEKGVDLGEMNKLLTKKVEELTLYMIEKDKQVQKEQETNQSQQIQIDELKKLVTQLIKHK